MKPALRSHLILAVPDLVALLFGVPFLIYFLSRAIGFTPQANQHLMVIGYPAALLTAVVTQIINRRRLKIAMPFITGGSRGEASPLVLKTVMNFPVHSALHMFVNFMIMVPLVWAVVNWLSPVGHPLVMASSTLVTGLVVGSLIFLIEEFLLRDTVASLTTSLADAGQSVVSATVRLGITQRLVGLFVVVMALALSFGLIMGRLNQTTVIGLIGLVATLCIAFLSAWSIKDTVQSLVMVLHGITTGGGISRRLPVMANNELGDLCREYNAFVGQIATLVEDVTRAAVDLAASSQQLAASSQEMNASAEEISSTIQQISRGASTQSERLTQVAKEVGTLSAAIKQIDSLGRMTTVSSQKSIEASKNGAQMTTEIVERMAEIYQSSAWATRQVQGLQQKSKEIGNVIGLISNIAQQTDFLALNAAIEAARAGEAGKGFSVVADEIRSLAVEAGNSAQQVTALIRDIEHEITRTVEGITQSQQAIEASRSAVDQTEQSLKVINSTVAVAGTMVKQTSRQQSESAGHVVSLASEVSTISIETASSTQEVAAAVEQQTASMEELSALSQTLSHTAESLSALVKRFRSDREG